jgi:ribose transport system substrate-binding protein
MRKLMLVLSLVLGVLLVGAPGEAAKKIKVGLVLETLGNPAFVSLKDGAVEEANKHPEVDLTVLAAATGTDLAGMTKMIEDMIQKRVDVLAFNAIDPHAVIPTIKKAQAAGVQVLVILDDAAEPVARHFVGPDQYGGQFAVAKLVAKLLSEKGKIAVLEGVPGNMASLLRKKGIQDAMKLYPNIEIVGIWAANWDRAQGLKKAEDILTAHPNINAIVAVNDDMALGALQAVKARGKLGKIIVTGFNGVEEAVQEVYRGNLRATVLTYLDEVGRQIIRTAIKVAQNKDDRSKYAIDTGTIPLDTQLLQSVGVRLKGALK